MYYHKNQLLALSEKITAIRTVNNTRQNLALRPRLPKHIQVDILPIYPFCNVCCTIDWRFMNVLCQVVRYGSEAFREAVVLGSHLLGQPLERRVLVRDANR